MKLTTSNPDLNVDQIMLAMELEERHLKTNRTKLDTNPEAYDRYLERVGNSGQYVMTYDEFKKSRSIQL